MSYEPRIFIHAGDLKKAQNQIENDHDYYVNDYKFLKPHLRIKKVDESIINAYKQIYDLLKHEPIIFDELSFYYIHVELTRYNQVFRGILDDYEVEYRIEN